MPDIVRLHYDVDGDNFMAAGEASSTVKNVLKRLGIGEDMVRRAAICLYEGEINMVIHANGGTIDVSVSPQTIEMVLKDQGEGIPDIEQAMQEGFSTASDRVRDLGFGAGMGLPNMRRYADSLEVSSEPGQGTRVVMTLNIAPA
ncbi:MAG: anti-sigma regulatory factor [Oscillospiraceae bacterium]|jgi:anti-sigma regulatory factor (Ser/Thr protein kinase)|nr:anti-sigma regulatory factor [Oscillospiraceae bacterium]